MNLSKATAVKFHRTFQSFITQILSGNITSDTARINTHSLSQTSWLQLKVTSLAIATEELPRLKVTFVEGRN
jgi:hypothetical protein